MKSVMSIIFGVGIGATFFMIADMAINDYNASHKVSSVFEETSSVELDIVPANSRFLCGEPLCLATYMWSGGSIVEVWYDPISKATDSLKRKRHKDANAFLKQYLLDKKRIDSLNKELDFSFLESDKNHNLRHEKDSILIAR